MLLTSEIQLSHNLLTIMSSPLAVISFCDHANNVFRILCLSLVAVVILYDNVYIYT